MTLMAASVALASAGCTRAPPGQAHPFVRMPEAGLGEGAIFYATSFVRSGFAHGVLVGTREGRPIKIEGNPLHPASLGTNDSFAQASVLELWDPDRSQTVQSRPKPGIDASPSTWAAFDTAWRERASRWGEGKGPGLRILTPTITSPTLQAQLGELVARYPGTVLHRHDPLSPASALSGTRTAFGRPVRPRHDFGKARLIVSFGADPFTGSPESVRCAADWARARAAAGTGHAARLVAVETTPGLFGARADDRIALPPAAIEALLERVAGHFIEVDRANDGNSNSAGPDADAARFETRLVSALRAAGPDALIVVGDALTPRAHVLAWALHQKLGSVGRTIEGIDPPEGGGGQDLQALLDAIRNGAVDTLLVIGGNPAYDTPGELSVAEAISQVPFTVRAGLYTDETARCCRWHLPLSHTYEQWSDARAFDGSASLIQPVIMPLYDTRSAHELVAAMLDDTVRDGRELVRRQWREQQPPGRAGDDFEQFWRESLRNGAIAQSAFEPLSLPQANVPRADRAPQQAGALAAVFVPDPSAGDGAFANNAWLQELPRPFTHITWGNALHLGPRTAASLSLRNGDVVRAAIGPKSIEAPVWVQASHAEGAATLPLGLGRTEAGRVGSGIGFDAYALRPAASEGTAPLTLTATGRHIEFARTQHTMSQEGRELARSVPASKAAITPKEPAPSLYPPMNRFAEHAWGMAIDLDACIGCNACTVACQAENNIPVVGAEQVARGRAMHWIRIDHYEEAEAPSHSGVFQPVPCMHCENAPCEIVCPVGATVHDSEGLNVQVYNRCVGTRFCSNNCPYKVRRFNFLQYSDESTETLKAQRNPDVTVRARGVMEKCTYCLQRITRARLQSERSGRPLADGDVVTACQAACPTSAIHFGDLADPGSAVSRAKASPRHYTLLEELNTRPRTTYLARVVADDEAGQ